MKCAGGVQVSGRRVVEEIAAARRRDRVRARRPVEAGRGAVGVEARVALLSRTGRRSVVQTRGDERVPTRDHRGVFGYSLLQLVGAGRPPHRGETARVNVDLRIRSEEHTSELQSPCNLVCRLLLEKKKKIKRYIRY